MLFYTILGIELVDDKVQASLRHEVQEIRRIREEMEKLQDRVNLQLSRNEEIRRNLKQDLSEKQYALSIDRSCSDLGEHSAKIHNNSGCHIVRS